MNINNQIQKILKQQKENYEGVIYPVDSLYQGFKEHDIEGKRDVTKRFGEYGLVLYLNKDMNVLDIGSNVCFFSIKVSDYVKSVDCVEINPYLIKIGKLVAKKLQVNNIKFYVSDFSKYEPKKKYDCIFSLAVDETAEETSNWNFTQYLNRLKEMLNDKGYLFFESQASDVLHKKIKQKEIILRKMFELVNKKEFYDNYPIKQKRLFYVFRK